MVYNSKTAILTGTTASGKTATALEVASRYGLEIINADSLLVYRGMDIGTAKPTRDELARVPHHLIDVRGPNEPYNAADFVQGVEAALTEIHARGKRALIAGGTGFYLKALLYGVWETPGTSTEIRARLEPLDNAELYARLKTRDPESAYRITQGDRYRLIRALEVIERSGKTPTELEAEQSGKAADARFRLLIVDRENEDLFARIEKRSRQMIDDGLVDETRRIRESYPDARPLDAVGYAQARDYFDGIKPESRKLREGLAGLSDEVALATRQLVKKQRTWFKGQLEGEWFILDRDRAKLDAVLESIYVQS